MPASTPELHVALVTGAGSGIGRATCLALATAGHALALVGRTERTLRETADLIGAQSAQRRDVPAAHIIPADVSDPDDAATAIDRAIAHWGRLDVLVNNAGCAEVHPIDATDQSLLERTFAVNAFGPAHLLARAWPIFQRQGGGCVVNVSSMSTLDPFPGLSVYAAAKSALESLTRSILSEGGKCGLRAFTVAPGAVETAMLRGIASEEALPPQCTLQPEQVAAVILDCIEGRREADIGRIIRMPSP